MPATIMHGKGQHSLNVHCPILTNFYINEFTEAPQTKIFKWVQNLPDLHNFKLPLFQVKNEKASHLVVKQVV